MIKLRLKKNGRKGQPCYRIVAMDSRTKRYGASIEELGFYNPMTDETHLKFERCELKMTEEKFVPGVIEPSFGIGRIVYCVLEHCFSIREKDEKRTLFKFPPSVAPYKVSVLPLIHSEEMLKFVEPLSKYFSLIFRKNSCKQWNKL